MAKKASSQKIVLNDRPRKRPGRHRKTTPKREKKRNFF